MSTYDIRIGKHDPLRLSEEEFKDFNTALVEFNSNGFRDGESRHGCARIVECGESPFGLPVVDMIERGWLPGVTDAYDPELMSALCKFFQVPDVAALKSLMESNLGIDGDRNG